MARETGLEPATSGVTGRLEDIQLQRDMELLGQENSLVGLTGVPTNLDGFLKEFAPEPAFFVPIAIGYVAWTRLV
jgi:hypothetical protein